jgi:H+-transporting ATPase
MALRSLTVVLLVFSGQAVLYAMRDRRHLWSSRPGRLLMLSSVIDIGIVSVLAANGLLMTALPITIMASLFVAAFAFAFLLDSIKAVLFHNLKIA